MKVILLLEYLQQQKEQKIALVGTASTYVHTYIDISVVKDNERCVSAKFEWHPFHSIAALRREQFPDCGRSCERELPNTLPVEDDHKTEKNKNGKNQSFYVHFSRVINNSPNQILNVESKNESIGFKLNYNKVKY